MVLSADPVTNHWFPGSTAMDLTQPRWPLMTCQKKHTTVKQWTHHSRVRTNALAKKRKFNNSYPKQFPRWMPLGFRHGWCFPHKRGISGAASLHDRLKQIHSLSALYFFWVHRQHIHCDLPEHLTEDETFLFFPRDDGFRRHWLRCDWLPAYV